MTNVGAYQAKTHLPALLERVEQGERFVITRHGKPVAELVPFSGRDRQGVREAIERVRAARRRLARRGVRRHALLRQGESLRDLAHDGHRY